MTANSGAEEIERKLGNLSAAIQIKVLSAVANHVASASKNRITHQTDLSGAAFTKRSENTDEKLARKRMLMGLRQRLRVLSITSDQAVIGFNGKAEKIASEQQHGIKDNPNPPKAMSAGRGNFRSRRAYDAASAASKKQAVALIKLGFTVKGKKPTVSYITEHLMYQKAGVIINLLRKKAGNAEKRDMYLPARSFLGITETDKDNIAIIMATIINEELSR